jgi:serine/threonine protein kinase
MKLFYDALKGIDFLHSNRWLHGDLKPNKIGIRGTRAVLLNMESSIHIPPNSLVSPAPGYGGTTWYLAPERDIQSFDYLVDIWSIGVVLFELAYGYHPWKFDVNPWRPGNENLRPEFHTKYGEAMSKIHGSKTLQSKVSSTL